MGSYHLCFCLAYVLGIEVVSFGASCTVASCNHCGVALWYGLHRFHFELIATSRFVSACRHCAVTSCNHCGVLVWSGSLTFVPCNLRTFISISWHRVVTFCKHCGGFMQLGPVVFCDLAWCCRISSQAWQRA